jgi:hypothetical protein
MVMTVELLARLIGSLPASQDAEAALGFLKQPDLIRIAPSGDEVSFGPAEECLRISRMRRQTATEAGIVTCGFASLLSALARLHPAELVTNAAFATADWYGTFWLDKADRFVGFVLAKRRSPEQEQDRLDWFRRNLT